MFINQIHSAEHICVIIQLSMLQRSIMNHTVKYAQQKIIGSLSGSVQVLFSSSDVSNH